MRTPIIAGNHKMNLTWQETRGLLEQLKRSVEDVKDVTVLICPPFTSLQTSAEVLKDTTIELGAQNMYWEPKGAYTGEISADMIKACGCNWVILGHSERRHIFGESDSVINTKLKSAFSAGLKPILCVGETLEERQAGDAEKILKRQIVQGLKNLSAAELRNLAVAYEPVWAIGTGKTATPMDADAGCSFIRSLLGELYGVEFADSIRILYGGSVKPNNIKSLMACTNIDGALVGGASLKPQDFAEIVRYYEQ